MMLDAITASQITLYVDEDQTLDSERSHTTEYGGYVTFATSGTYYLNSALPAYDEPVMEVGVIYCNGQYGDWQCHLPPVGPPLR